MDGAKGYDVYFGKCGSKIEKVGSVSAEDGRGYRFSKLEKHTGYKAYVQAWTKVKGKKSEIGKASPIVHAFTGNGTKDYTNAASVKVKSDTMKLIAGRTGSIEASVKGVQSDKKICAHAGLLRYYSSNRNVAKVNGKGQVTAVGKGSCSVYVIATNGARTRVKVKVKVVTAPTGLAFEKDSYSVKKGKTLNLAKRLKVTPSATKTTYTWKSSDKTVAKVNAKGVVKALSKGTVTITVKAENGRKAKVKVKVK